MQWCSLLTHSASVLVLKRVLDLVDQFLINLLVGCSDSIVWLPDSSTGCTKTTKDYTVTVTVDSVGRQKTTLTAYKDCTVGFCCWCFYHGSHWQKGCSHSLHLIITTYRRNATYKPEISNKVGDEDWKRLTACLFKLTSTNKKAFKLHTVYSGI